MKKTVIYLVVLLGLCLSCLSACGQKGALYLPEKTSTPTPISDAPPVISDNPNDY